MLWPASILGLISGLQWLPEGRGSLLTLLKPSRGLAEEGYIVFRLYQEGGWVKANQNCYFPESCFPAFHSLRRSWSWQLGLVGYTGEWRTALFVWESDASAGVLPFTLES